MQLMNPPIETGDRVKVALMNGPWDFSNYVDLRFNEARQHPGAVGTVGSWVPGTNEELWYVHHDIPYGSIAVYWSDELEHYRDDRQPIRVRREPVVFSVGVGGRVYDERDEKIAS